MYKIWLADFQNAPTGLVNDDWPDSLAGLPYQLADLPDPEACHLDLVALPEPIAGLLVGIKD